MAHSQRSIEWSYEPTKYFVEWKVKNATKNFRVYIADLIQIENEWLCSVCGFIIPLKKYINKKKQLNWNVWCYFVLFACVFFSRGIAVLNFDVSLWLKFVLFYWCNKWERKQQNFRWMSVNLEWQFLPTLYST